MDKQIMDLTSSSSPPQNSSNDSSSPPQNSSNDYIDLINHPQNEDVHNLASGFSVGNNWVNNKEEIVPSYDFIRFDLFQLALIPLELITIPVLLILKLRSMVLLTHLNL